MNIAGFFAGSLENAAMVRLIFLMLEKYMLYVKCILGRYRSYCNLITVVYYLNFVFHRSLFYAELI